MVVSPHLKFYLTLFLVLVIRSGAAPYQAAEINRNAVGGRLKPKGGLQAYFEPLSPSLKDTNSLTGKARR